MHILWLYGGVKRRMNRNCFTAVILSEPGRVVLFLICRDFETFWDFYLFVPVSGKWCVSFDGWLFLKRNVSPGFWLGHFCKLSGIFIVLTLSHFYFSQNFWEMTRRSWVQCPCTMTHCSVGRFALVWKRFRFIFAREIHARHDLQRLLQLVSNTSFTLV